MSKQDKNQMTYKESIYKMLEQVLKNQLDMMEWGCRNVQRERIAETEALLEQVKA